MKEMLIECYEPSNLNPEKAFLAALLELAIRDLNTGGIKELKSAIEWFSGTHKECSTCITYIALIEFLDLGEGIVHRIKDMVVLGEERLEKLRTAKRSHLRGQFANSGVVTIGKNGKAFLRGRRPRVFSR